MTRRQLMLSAAAMAPTPDPLSAASLYQDVVTYSDFGDHRTATPVDRKTAAWLATGLGNAGLAVEQRSFTLQQFFLRNCRIVIEGNSLPAVPLWWPKPTGHTPIEAKLVAVPDAANPWPLQGCIACVTLPDVRSALERGSPIHPVVAALNKAGALAIIGVSPVPTREPVALNAEAGLDPWPLPIVLVGTAQQDALRDAARRAARVSVLIEGNYDEQAQASEVIGRLSRGKRLILVSTPYSGWFRCAGERGPGIALWLALARWAAARKSDTSFIFVASSAHELDGVGIRHFLAEVAPKPPAVTAWLHLGAGIATYDYRVEGSELMKLPAASTARRLYSAQQFAPLLRKTFAGLPDLQPTVTNEPRGESLMIARAGYRYFGFAGLSMFHHMPGDLPHRSTGGELIEPVARALTATIEAIEKLA